MKKILTLLFSVGLVTAAFAQRSDSYRNDSRDYDNSYQSSPYSNNDQYSYNDQYRNDDYYNRNSQWNDRSYQFDRDRRRRARERYEYEMMMRRRQAMMQQRMYYNYPYGGSRPSLQIRIGIGGHRY